jgi:hypothetical protein
MSGLTPDAPLILAMCVFLVFILVFVVIVMVINSRKVNRPARDLFDALTPFFSSGDTWERGVG